ncbi:MAG TPA: PH domain-containing protein, partial [Allosphingosinicella sp.]
MSEAGVVADRRLHPATLVSRTLRVIPEAAGGMAAYGALIARAELRQIAAMALVGIAVAGIAALLSWWRFRYGVGEREIVIESGVVRRQRRVIPFERVQDIAIERRLLARMFGTAHVKIETGGAKADEGHLDSIALADAFALRDVIRGARTADGAGEAAGEAEEPLLFAMDVPRVLFSG